MERFDTQSGNIHCQSFTSSFVCHITSGLVPEPPAAFCGAQWAGVFIDTGRFAGPSCSGDPLFLPTDNVPVLPWGSTWSRGGVTCELETTGLTCTDAAGNGFWLASAGWDLLGKEDAARAAFGDLRNIVRHDARSAFGSELESIDTPVLGGTADCGDDLQGASVPVTVHPNVGEVYRACFVSGTWHVTQGPTVPAE